MNQCLAVSFPLCFKADIDFINEGSSCCPTTDLPVWHTPWNDRLSCCFFIFQAVLCEAAESLAAKVFPLQRSAAVAERKKGKSFPSLDTWAALQMNYLEPSLRFLYYLQSLWVSVPVTEQHASVSERDQRFSFLWEKRPEGESAVRNRGSFLIPGFRTSRGHEASEFLLEVQRSLKQNL